MSELTARDLLGRVLAKGREQVERSPESVAAVTGVAGKTIRRLEDGESRPRASTLGSLGQFYAFDVGLLRQLGEWDELAGEELRGSLRELAVARFGPDVLDVAEETDDDMLWLAMRLARGGATGKPAMWWGQPGSQRPLAASLKASWPALSAAQEKQMVALLENVMVLDERRRALICELAHELHDAQLSAHADSDAS